MRRLLFALCPLPSAFATQPPNMLLGTQAIGGRYQFTQDELLLESAKLIAELGSSIMKFSISKQASFGQTKANVRGSQNTRRDRGEGADASCGARHVVHSGAELGQARRLNTLSRKP